jgi:O-antigen ligase
MRLNLVAVAYALWLLATELLYYVTGSYYANGGNDLTTLEVSVLLGLIPAAMQILFLGFSPHGLLAPVRMVLCFLLVVLVGYLGNAYGTSLIWLASLAFVFAIGILVAGSPDERLIRSIGVFYSVPAALFLLYVAATGEHVWGRLEAQGIQPNWWGLMGAGLAMAAFAHRSRLLAALCIGIGFYIAYDASSRSNMLAIFLGLVAVGALELRALRGSRLLAAIAATLGALIVFMLFSSAITDALTKAVIQTMQIYDPGRGIGSGFTGREGIWEDVVGIWLRAPLFGVGFHQHKLFTIDQAEAHQVYLGMLVDTGIFGLIWYLWFLGASLYAASRIGDRSVRNVAVATIVAYMVIGFFDARGFSSGNPTSLYFEMCCFFALRHESLLRVPRSALSPAIVGPG